MKHGLHCARKVRLAQSATFRRARRLRFRKGGGLPQLAHRVALGYVQYFADMTTTAASSSHETINPVNIVQPRAFVIAETVAGLLTVASACIPSFPVRAGVPSCSVAPSSTAFDGRGNSIGPVATVEDKSPTLPFGFDAYRCWPCFPLPRAWGSSFFHRSCSYGLTIALAPRRGSAERGSGSLNPMGVPPALPGRQQKFDISGGRHRRAIDEIPNREPPSTREESHDRWTAMRG